MKLIKNNTVVLMFSCMIVLFGCQENINHSDYYPSYKLKASPITSVVTDWAVVNGFNFINEEQSLLAEFSYNKNQIRIINTSKDSLLKTITIPFPIKKMGSISLIDTNSFAFITDTTFYIYNQGKFIRLDYGLFNDGYIPLNYINIIYKPDLNVLIAAVLSYSNKDEESYSSNFLNIYNLNDTTSNIIAFSYPKQFHDFKLGVPKALLSSFENNLLVSFKLDDYVYKINLLDNDVEKILCKSKISTIMNMSFPKDGTKQEKIDAIQKNDIEVGGYGIAFYNGFLNQIYRTYNPGLPNKDKEGNYYNSTDRGLHILKLDILSEEIDEYKLPNGQYFVNSSWGFNKFKNTLVYPVLLENINYENTCYYNIHSLFFYNN